MSYALKTSQFKIPPEKSVNPVTDLRERIISQRSLITQHRPRTDDCRATDVTTATGDCARQLRLSPNARVWPDNAILNARTFLHETSLAQHRVNDLRARFDLAIVTNQRQLINLRTGRRIKLPAPLLHMKPRHTIRQQIRMNL